MDIIKNGKTYTITECTSKWIIKSTSGKLSVSFDVSKEICKTVNELHEYILSNKMFWGVIMNERKQTPQERYAAKYKKQFKIDCFTSTEMDIIEKLESVPNKAGYIKSLIRKDIEENK